MAGLAKAGGALGGRWNLGLVLYAGHETVIFDERTLALPINALLLPRNA